jgi:nucleoside-diphosphate-sugar epimerase
MIVITGASGLVGSALRTELDKRAIEYIGIDSTVTDNESSVCVTDFNSALALSFYERADHVIHLAGASSNSYFHTANENELFTQIRKNYELFKFIALKTSASLIYASTEWVYSAPNNSKSSLETDFINFYGLQGEYPIYKFLSEKLLVNSGFPENKLTIFRFGIVLSEKRVITTPIEDLCLAFAGKDNEIVVKSKNIARNYIYIDDLIDGIILGIKGGLNGLFNLGGSDRLSVGAAIKMLELITKTEKSVKIIEPSLVNERFLDSTKYQLVSNFKPRSASQILETLFQKYSERKIY